MRQNLIEQLHRGNKRRRLSPPRLCSFCGLVKVVTPLGVPDDEVYCLNCTRNLDRILDAAEADLVLPADPPGQASDKKLCATLYASITEARAAREPAPEPAEYDADFYGRRR